MTKKTLLLIIAVLFVGIFTGISMQGLNKSNDTLKNILQINTKPLTKDEQVKLFISKLPMGDVSTERCQELISDKRQELYNDDPSNNSAVIDTKYIYSKKLCLANIDFLSGGKYPNESDEIQILDLGSNEIFAYYHMHGVVNKDGTVNDEKLVLWSEEQTQKPYLNIVSDLWFKLKKQY